jgi:hypothetical protein
VAASPDVAAAVDRLARDQVLSADQAALFGRVARAELATLAPLLDAALYLGVVTIVGGAGLLLAARAGDLGPLALALVIGLAALACLAWVARQAPPFTRGVAPAPGFALDYVLLLGALLAAADLAFVEVRFTPLGPRWSWHLLVVAVGFGALAVRYDSRPLFGLALANLAAWRGVAVLTTEQALLPWAFAGADVAVRANAIACGGLFIGLGAWLLRARLKPHFEPVATLLGWALVLAGVAGGIGSGPAAMAWELALLGLGLFLAWRAWPAEGGRRSEAAGRYWLLVMGVGAAWIALLAVTLPAFNDPALALLYVAGTAAAVVAALVRAQRARRSQRS